MSSRALSKLAELAEHENYALKKPATKAALDGLEKKLGQKLSKQHRAALETSDGWGSLESYEVLSVKGIASWAATMKKDRKNGAPWKETWIPFGVDSCGNVRCVDSKSDRVVQADRQEGPDPTEFKHTLNRWFESIGERLSSGELVVDEEGFITEPVTPPVVPEPAKKLPRIESADRMKKIEAALDEDDVKKFVTLIGKRGPNQTSWTDQPLIVIAAEKNARKSLEWILANEGDVDCGKAQGERTALYWALWGDGNIELAKYLLSRGADPNAMTSYEGTPLHSAAMWDNAEGVQLLLAAGADPTLMDASGNTPVKLAKAKAKAVFANPKMKLEKPKKVVSTLPKYSVAESKKLDDAILRDDAVAFAKAATKGANAETCHGVPLIDAAAAQKSVKCVKWLLENGADANVSTERGKESALYWGIRGPRGSLAVTKLLLGAGARPDNKSLLGAVDGDHLEAAKLLIEKGADPKHTLDDGRTLMDFARSTEMEKLLRR